MDASEKQLANIESSSGLTLAEFVDKIHGSGAEKHGAIVKFLKEELGLTHGNANLISLRAREIMAGGRASDEDLLAAQFKGAKEKMRSTFEQLDRDVIGACEERVVQKTGISYRTGRKQFALVKIASGKRIELGLNLPDTPDDGRVRKVAGMCTHRIDIAGVDELDGDLAMWIRSAEEHCS